MFFPQTSEYALRAMARLAFSWPGNPVKARDLSSETLIPVHYLSKVMRRLVTAGLVDGTKGHGGGFRLAKSPEKISFARILEAVDYGASTRCAFGWARCNANKPCPLHPFWGALKETFGEWARKTTLEDVRESGNPDYWKHFPRRLAIKGSRGRPASNAV